MADLPNREKLEGRIERIVNKALRPYRRVKSRRMPPWAKIRDQLLKDLHPQLERVRLEAARAFASAYGDGPLPPGFEQAASTRTADLVADMVDWSRREWLGMKKPRSKADILKWRKTHLGPGRARRIAITELTIAQSKGEMEALKYFRERGLVVEAIWNVTETACDICLPFHRAEEAKWRAAFPSGPPAHVSCNCFVTYEKKKAGKKTKVG